MKPTLLLAILLAALWSPSAYPQSPEPAQTSPTSADAEVLKAVDEFYKAFLAGDIETVTRMTADDYLQTDVNGQVQDKAAWLAHYYEPMVRGVKAGTFKWEVFERKDIKVRRYGDVAVLIGRTRLKRNGPNSVARELRFTQVWVKREGRWQRAVFHNALLPESR